MKFILLILLLTSSVYAKVDKLVSLTLVDPHGLTETIRARDRLERYRMVNFLQPQPYKKVVRVYGKEKEGSLRTYITSYYPSGQVKRYLQVIGSRACGIYQEWHPSSQRKLCARVVGGESDVEESAIATYLFDGPAEVWDEEGHPLALFSYARGVLEGAVVEYHSTGALKERAHFANGLRHGLQQRFFEGGELKEEITFHQGQPQGVAQGFWPSGKPSYSEIYKKGLLFEANYLDEQGECIATIHQGLGRRAHFLSEERLDLIEYREGVAEGSVEELDADGHLLRRYHTKNGVKHGEEMEYYPSSSFVPSETLRPKLLVTWHLGQLHGTAKSWYPSGQLESQREMAHNRRFGLSTGWYEEGQIMLIEEYQEDRLMKGSYFSPDSNIPVSQVVSGTGTATLYDGSGHLIRKVVYLDGLPETKRT